MTGLSFAQAIDCILQHRWGVSLNPSAETSISIMLMDDDRIPPGAGADAERELLTALSEARISASGVHHRSREIVDIPAGDWLRLQIWPSFDGDAARYDALHYEDLRMLPADVRRLWPPCPTGRRPSLRVVGGISDMIRPSPAPVPAPEPDRIAVETVERKARGRPAKFNWQAFEQEVARMVEYEGGAPDPSIDPAWSQAEIERRMTGWCAAHWRIEPGESTIREHVVKALKDIEGQKGQ